MRPVAYDADGNPLYASPEAAMQASSGLTAEDQEQLNQDETEQSDIRLRPKRIPASHAQPQPQVVHMTRALEPIEMEVSPEIKERHDKSVEKFPWLNLSDHEYIIVAIRRHPIGLLIPAAFTAISIAIVFTMIFNFPFISSQVGIPMSAYGLIMLIGILMIILLLVGGYAAIWVFTNNRFFLTNESVIQEIQAGLFTHREQTVSLMNIEDASYNQNGPLRTLLNYGTIRLSTEGDETTYRFDYVANPKDHIAILNNAVEAFKNGRPVGVEALSGEVDTAIEEMR